MKPLHPGLRSLVFPLFLLAGSCMNATEEDKKPSSGSHPTSGGFKVSLAEPTGFSAAYASILGKVYDGPSPSVLAWKQVAAGGACKLYTPSAPFCETPCGSKALCVADNTCQDYPRPISAGKVAVKGVKVKSGPAPFTMDTLLSSYQQPTGTQLDFPPFSEGDAVTFSAAGDTGIPAFTVSAGGISPLVILNDSITLADGKPILLKWTPAKTAGSSTVSAMVDISHHGGSKGKIECEGPDNGEMEIAAALVDQLKALGVSGFPKVEVTRKAVGVNKDVNVSLSLESMVTKSLSIPGLISCGGDEECPDGKTCQSDMQCK
jgi:hypothetical protein